MKVKKMDTEKQVKANTKECCKLEEQVKLEEDFNHIVDAKWDEKNHCYILPKEELEDWD